MERFLNQNPHFETKHFTELVTEHLMKFQKEIYSYYPSLDKDKLACFRNPFIANAPMLQTGTGTREELVKVQVVSLACDVY